MKKLEFKTSKGSFILSDENYYLVNQRGVKTAYLNNKKQFEYFSFIRLSEITEQQASEIVYSWTQNFTDYTMYMNYKTKFIDCQLTAIESLHSLLKSKGVYLYENPHNAVEAEQKTFYNPVIFKL